MIHSFSLFTDWALLAVRLVFGLIFLAHGWSKLRNLKQTQEWFQSIGFRPGFFWGTLVAFTETLGSLAIIFGSFTQIAALLLAIVMVNSTIWRLRSGHKLVGGYEIDLILLAVALFLAVNGAGLYSLDNHWNLY